MALNHDYKKDLHGYAENTRAELNKRSMEFPSASTGQLRERRERPRMSDISRAVDKAVPDSNTWDVAEEGRVVNKKLGPIPPVDPQLEALLAKKLGQSATEAPAFDKNTPSSLKQLRWAIYEAIDMFESDIAKIHRLRLQETVEDLFKEYTNS